MDGFLPQYVVKNGTVKPFQEFKMSGQISVCKTSEHDVYLYDKFSIIGQFEGNCCVHSITGIQMK